VRQKAPVRPPVRALAPQAPAEAVAAQEPGPEPAWFHSKHHQRPAARQRLKKCERRFWKSFEFPFKDRRKPSNAQKFRTLSRRRKQRFNRSKPNQHTIKTAPFSTTTADLRLGQKWMSRNFKWWRKRRTIGLRFVDRLTPKSLGPDRWGMAQDGVLSWCYTKIESTVKDLGIEVNDATAIAKQV
jgi:hypothetical protein